MTDSLHIGYFLEDIAQEKLITGVVQRVADQMGIQVAHDVRNATGGQGRVLTELRRYLADIRRGRIAEPPVLVVAIDGNCSSYQEKRRQIQQLVEQAEYSGTVIYAIPNPHIECWYLADPDGFRAAISGSEPPPIPSRKCDRGWYKRALIEAFRTANIIPQLGGAEFADAIVANMALDRIQQSDRALGHFVADTRSALTRHRNTV